ncbi:MAG: helix-turn-helix domain-containing protein [Sulfurimonas sp.]|nr:helix-turn-helix domain-containing protein [Sulfurimonas sp.]
MPLKQLVDSIKQRKQELGLTIDNMSSKSGVGTRTINRILAGEDVRYSSIESLLKSLNLSLSIGKC